MQFGVKIPTFLVEVCLEGIQSSILSPADKVIAFFLKLVEMNRKWLKPIKKTGVKTRKLELPEIL